MTQFRFDTTQFRFPGSSLAVDRALNLEERRVFHECYLSGSYNGAQPADWIEQARENDAHLDRVEPWWDNHGDKAVAEMVAQLGLPEDTVRSLLNAALYATIAVNGAIPEDRRRAVAELATAAGLWTLGYAERTGFRPAEFNDDGTRR